MAVAILTTVFVKNLVNVRFGSLATWLVKADARTCPLYSDRGQR
jgi:hypothetical protein